MSVTKHSGAAERSNLQTDKLSNDKAGQAEIGPLPSKYRVTTNEYLPYDWCMIFNSHQFFELHRTANSFYFRLISGDPAQVLGVAHFTEVAPGHYRSPQRGTFGGFECRGDRCRAFHLFSVLVCRPQEFISTGLLRLAILNQWVGLQEFVQIFTAFAWRCFGDVLVEIFFKTNGALALAAPMDCSTISGVEPATPGLLWRPR